jgi:glycosyltransferase involved in cell wall biosynthesis
MQKKKMAIIGTVGIPANYGGFETLAEHLVEELHDDLEISVYCSGKKYPKHERVKKYKGAKLLYLPFDANGLQSIIYDSVSIIHAMFTADVLLVLGVAGGFLFPFVRLFSNKKIIVSIDGIEWKRNKWNKWLRWFLWASEWFAVKFSHADIADNESIQDYTAMRYKTLSNIIEYGADHTQKVIPTTDDRNKYLFLNGTYAFKVCRIEPENNIHTVLAAFAKLPEYKLVLVGNWNANDYGKNLREKYSSYSNLILLDPIYNQRELDLLRGNCMVYIHGHSAGGTNPSLVEAMYLGLPVIAFNVNYNKSTTEYAAQYFKSSEELIDIISKNKFSDFISLGYKMAEIAHRRYTWKAISNKYFYLVKKVSAKKIKSSVNPFAEQQTNQDILTNMGLGHLSQSKLFFEKIK